MSHVFARNHAKFSQNSITSIQRSFCKILRFPRFQEKNLIASQKTLQAEVRKVGGNVAVFMRFGPFFYDKRKARQDKMFILH